MTSITSCTIGKAMRSFHSSRSARRLSSFCNWPADGTCRWSHSHTRSICWCERPKAISMRRFAVRARRHLVTEPFREPGRQGISAKAQKIDMAEKSLMRQHDQRQEIRSRFGPLREFFSTRQVFQKGLQHPGIAGWRSSLLEPDAQFGQFLVCDLAGGVGSDANLPYSASSNSGIAPACTPRTTSSIRL